VWRLLKPKFKAIARATLLFGTVVPGAVGQTPARPDYEIIRYEEDWSFLADPSLRQDPWDRWKYIDLHHPGWYLTLAGEARERYEVLDHPDFGTGPTDTNGYMLQRYLFSGDFHFGERFRFFGELQSGLENGRNGGPRLTDLDKLDIHQAFVDIGLLQHEHHKLTLRLGRQEVRFGTGRLISPGEGLNVRRSFDGARLIYETGRWVWNATALRLVNISPGFFDDLPDHTQTFWGVGVIGPHPFWSGANFTIYYLGDNRKDAVFDRGQGTSSRETLGSRSWKTFGPWDMSYEGIFQWGTFASAPIRAWAFSSETGYTLRNVRLTPRFGLHLDVTSGDHRTHTLGSFDPLFPSATAYPDPSGILGPTNLIVPEPSVKLQFTPKLSLALASAAFFRESTDDGVYGIFLTPVRPSGPSAAQYVATQASATLICRVSRHVTATLYGQHFFIGEFLEESPPARVVNFGNATLSYRF
jgi:hypothetical protein